MGCVCRPDGPDAGAVGEAAEGQITIHSLSPDETDVTVILMVSRGMTRTEIAARLRASRDSIDTSWARVMRCPDRRFVRLAKKAS